MTRASGANRPAILVARGLLVRVGSARLRAPVVVRAVHPVARAIAPWRRPEGHEEPDPGTHINKLRELQPSLQCPDRVAENGSVDLAPG
jgi:hypothetical protein